MHCKIFIAFIVCMLLTGCGVGEASSAAESQQSVTTNDSLTITADSSQTILESGSSLTELAAAIQAVDPDILNKATCYGNTLFEKNVVKLYQCELADLTDGMIVYNSGGGFADEISIIERADGDTDKASAVLQRRIDLRYADFENYKPDQLAKITAGKVFAVGTKTVLIISNQSEKIESIIRDSLQ